MEKEKTIKDLEQEITDLEMALKESDREVNELSDSINELERDLEEANEEISRLENLDLMPTFDSLNEQRKFDLFYDYFSKISLEDIEKLTIYK